jgi:hypothetical protein
MKGRDEEKGASLAAAPLEDVDCQGNYISLYFLLAASMHFCLSAPASDLAALQCRQVFLLPLRAVA